MVEPKTQEASMIDKIASFVLYVCGIADVFVAVLYASEKRYYAAGYWLAAAVIVVCIVRGMR